MSLDSLLRFDQFIEGEGIQFLPTKTEKSSGASVMIPITPEIRDVLERARAIGSIKSVYVIHTLKGRPYSASGLRKAFVTACQQVGISGITLRDIRSKAAKDAKTGGATLEQLKVALAHMEIATTEGYLAGLTTPVSEIRMRLPWARKGGK